MTDDTTRARLIAELQAAVALDGRASVIAALKAARTYLRSIEEVGAGVLDRGFLILEVALRELDIGKVSPLLRLPPDLERNGGQCMTTIHANARAYAVHVSDELMRRSVPRAIADQLVAARLNRAGLVTLRGRRTAATGTTIKGWRKEIRHDREGKSLIASQYEHFKNRTEIESDQTKLLDDFERSIRAMLKTAAPKPTTTPKVS